MITEAILFPMTLSFKLDQFERTNRVLSHRLKPMKAWKHIYIKHISLTHVTGNSRGTETHKIKYVLTYHQCENSKACSTFSSIVVTEK